MICTQCNKEVADNVEFCPECGCKLKKPVQPQAQPQTQPRPQVQQGAQAQPRPQVQQGVQAQPRPQVQPQVKAQPVNDNPAKGFAIGGFVCAFLFSFFSSYPSFDFLHTSCARQA